jgi:hypothetical protein
MPFTFTVTRSISSEVGLPLTVDLEVSGTAVFEADYLVSGADTFSETEATVTIPANQLVTTIIVNPIPDFTAESDKTIVLTLLPTIGISALGENPSAIATILDDDSGGGGGGGGGFES